MKTRLKENPCGDELFSRRAFPSIKVPSYKNLSHQMIFIALTSHRSQALPISMTAGSYSSFSGTPHQ